MFDRVSIHMASGSGGGGRAHLGYALGASGMKCRVHNTNCGSGSTENEISPADYLTIRSISQDVATVVSQLSNKTFTEYTHFVSVPHTDTVLNSSGNWPNGNFHYPYK